MIDLLSKNELPTEFRYPKEFLWVVDLPITYIKPWLIHSGLGLRTRHEGIKARFPHRNLVPFAFRQDCDEVACWDLIENGKVVVIEDYTRGNLNEDTVYADFLDCFKNAVDDMIEFCKRDTED